MTEAQLREELAQLAPDLRARLDAAGFDPERLVALAQPLFARARGESGPDGDARNRVRGPVQPPRAEDILDPPATGSDAHERLSALGREALGRGELAFCVLAGGMATRMGGVVKSLVEALDGRTFLDLRLAENATWSVCSTPGRDSGGGRSEPCPMPMWLMTSDATDGPIRDALARRGAPDHVVTFTQDLGVRLTREGRLFRGDDGAPSTYAPGHGDLQDALRRSGLLESFVTRGGKYVWIANIDNLGASVDPTLLGLFIDRGAPVLVEVTPKVAGDRGGIPVWSEAEDERAAPEAAAGRRLQVLEEFRLPSGFDADSVRVFNTNTFLVDAPALLRTRVRHRWFEVEKKVNGRPAVQFERLLQELTSALPSIYVRVPREGSASRFLPVKDYDELARRRDQIRAVVRERGMDGGSAAP